LRSILKYAKLNESVKDRARHTHISRLIEGLPVEFPIEPDETRWERSRDDKVRISFSFKNREDLKDFVCAIQELEDRMQHFVEIKVEKKQISIEEEVTDRTKVSDLTQRFFMKIKEIYEDMNLE
jgi:pterin-4a-carbinolamine dehydratase